MDSLLLAWTCAVLAEWNGRDAVPLAEVSLWVDMLLNGCERLFDVQEMRRLRRQAACILKTAVEE